jgi:hypothetical protein
MGDALNPPVGLFSTCVSELSLTRHSPNIHNCQLPSALATRLRLSFRLDGMNQAFSTGKWLKTTNTARKTPDFLTGEFNGTLEFSLND